MEFREALAAWFARHGKDYPWRRTRDAYAVLVSEVMLQQTQIATVLGKGYYTRFLETFPDLASLAAADDERLLKAWEGLGYYRRARMLRETARAVIARHGGMFPQQRSGRRCQGLKANVGMGRGAGGQAAAPVVQLGPDGVGTDALPAGGAGLRRLSGGTMVQRQNTGASAGETAENPDHGGG